MKVTNLLTDDKAVSSTLGIVLLVAVTVILAAITGAFAFGLLGQEAAPNAEFDYDFNGAGDEVIVTLETSEGLDADDLSFGAGWGTDSANNCQFASGDVETGDVVIDDGSGNRCEHGAGAGTDLSIIWESQDGKQFVIDERSRSA